MKLLRASALAVLLAPAAAGAQSADSAARVDSVFARFGPATPGCAVGVARDGRPVLSRAYGMADLEHDAPNTPSTIFEAGSVTKQFTAAAVVLLAQDGLLSLDDDVRKYIPELPEYAAPITLRHLLTHTSGLRDWGSVAAIAGWPRGSRTYTHAHVLDIALRQRALNYPTGQYYSYTNTGYNLLAMVVERVSGTPLPEFTQTRLFAPLGMTSTAWRDDYTRVVKGRAVAYRTTPGGFRMDMPFENVFGNGGLLTTTADLLRWNENLRTGQVGGPAFIREMHRQMRLNGGREIEYASGLFVTRYRGMPEVSHSGATAGYRAFLARYPEQRLDVALLCNAGSANPGALAHQVADVFLPAAAAETRERPAAVDAAVLQSRAGLYRDTHTAMVMRLAVRDGALTAVGRGPLAAASPTRFRAGEAWMVFDEAAAGRAGFNMLTPDGDSVRFEPVADFAPTAAQLAGFAGTYTSDEADADLTFAVADGKLMMRDAGGNAAPLEPAYADAFSMGGGVIRFTRGPGGRVTGATVVSDRVWSMDFQRR